MLVFAGSAVVLFARFRVSTPVLPSGSAATLGLLVLSLIVAALVASFIGIVLTGLVSILSSASQPEESQIIAIECEGGEAGAHYFTLARCPACGYDRHGLAIEVPCPECNEPAPIRRRFEGDGRAITIYGDCPVCSRALTKGRSGGVLRCQPCGLILRKKVATKR